MILGGKYALPPPRSTCHKQHSHTPTRHLTPTNTEEEEQTNTANMKTCSFLFAAIGLTAVSAFTPQPFARTQISTRNGEQSQVVLSASKNRDKVASRSKWADARGYGSTAASASSGAGKSAPKLIIAGAPASGKGTQCELIKEKYGVVHLSTGDMLRAAVAAGTEVGKQAKDFMDAGKLVPDEVIIGVVSYGVDVIERGRWTVQSVYVPLMSPFFLMHIT